MHCFIIKAPSTPATQMNSTTRNVTGGGTWTISSDLDMVMSRQNTAEVQPGASIGTGMHKLAQSQGKVVSEAEEDKSIVERSPQN